MIRQPNWVDLGESTDSGKLLDHILMWASARETLATMSYGHDSSTDERTVPA